MPLPVWGSETISSTGETDTNIPRSTTRNRRVEAWRQNIGHAQPASSSASSASPQTPRASSSSTFFENEESSSQDQAESASARRLRLDKALDNERFSYHLWYYRSHLVRKKGIASATFEMEEKERKARLSDIWEESRKLGGDEKTGREFEYLRVEDEGARWAIWEWGKRCGLVGGDGDERGEEYVDVGDFLLE